MVTIAVRKNLSEFALHKREEGSPYPYYHLVPKDFKQNAQWRYDLLTKWSDTKAKRKQIWNMCAQDLLFYVNSFVYTYDPRKIGDGESPDIPFITRTAQDECFDDLRRGIGKEDRCLAKSRDEGASWICLTVFEWRWHFSPKRESYLMISRTAEYVDDPDNPDSLFWKIDYIHQFQQECDWILPKFTRRQASASRPGNYLNHRNGAVIGGTATSGEAGRGGRRTAVFIDEHNAFEIKAGFEILAAIDPVTNSKIINGTVSSAGTAYEVLRNKPEIKKTYLWWFNNPEKAVGIKVDASIPGEGGGFWSPWLQLQIDRAVDVRKQVFAEICGDAHAADHPFYPAELLDSIREKYVMDPFLRGKLEFMHDSCEPIQFVPDDDGPVLLWCHLGPDWKPRQHGEYASGADIGEGTGASNSCVSFLDLISGEKVCEFAHAHMDDHEFAEYALALHYWFGGFEKQDVFALWEAAGPGRTYGSVFLQHGYRNVFYRQQEDKITQDASDFPGWWPSRSTIRSLHSNYRVALKNGSFINRSEQALVDLEGYMHLPGDLIVHSAAQNTLDPTGAKDSHGDRGVADALAWKGAQEMGADRKGPRGEEKKFVPPGSFGARREEYLRKREKDRTSPWGPRIGRWR